MAAVVDSVENTAVGRVDDAAVVAVVVDDGHDGGDDECQSRGFRQMGDADTWAIRHQSLHIRGCVQD